MRVAGHRSNRQLDVKKSPRTKPDDRPAVLFGSALLPNRSVGAQRIGVSGDPIGEVGRPDLLLSLGQPGDGTRVIPAHRLDGVDGRQPGEELALVVLGTSCVDGTIPLGQLKGW